MYSNSSHKGFCKNYVIQWWHPLMRENKYHTFLKYVKYYDVSLSNTSLSNIQMCHLFKYDLIYLYIYIN